jgi:hypothetical protein
MMRLSLWAPQALLVLLLASTTSPDSPSSSLAPDLPLDEIIERVQQHTAIQSKQLETYQATRHYEVQYKGYGANLSGGMVVEVHFDRSAGKTLRILSQTGSKLLCDKVLKKAVESEREAAENTNSTALSPANYRFKLTGTDVLNGHPSYVLRVDPLHPTKFLYRGKIWVDATDFAVAKIEVEPAKNPSVWIASSKIENTYAATEGVWLPQRNRSESKIRIGGTAVLTIDYGTYQVAVVGSHAQAGRHLVSPAINAAGF